MEIPKLKQHLAVVFCDIAGTSQLMALEGDLVVADLLRAFFENAGRLGTDHDPMVHAGMTVDEK